MLSPPLAFQQNIEKPASKKGVPQSEPIPHSDASVKSTSSPSSSLLYSAPTYVHSSSGSSDVLHEMLVLPQPMERSQESTK